MEKLYFAGIVLIASVLTLECGRTALEKCTPVSETDLTCDGIDDDCDGFTNGRDKDEDGYPSSCDNCPEEANPDQADRDGDGLGDACDAKPDIFNYTLGPALISMGGGISISVAGEVEAVIGQPIEQGKMKSRDYEISSGFATVSVQTK